MKSAMLKWSVELDTNNESRQSENNIKRVTDETLLFWNKNVKKDGRTFYTPGDVLALVLMN